MSSPALQESPCLCKDIENISESHWSHSSDFLRASRGTRSPVQTQGWRSAILRAMVSMFVPWVGLPLAGTKGCGPITCKIQGSFYCLSTYVLSLPQRSKYQSAQTLCTEEGVSFPECRVSVCSICCTHGGSLLPPIPPSLVTVGRKVSKLSLC